jgi:hypothetical protein
LKGRLAAISFERTKAMDLMILAPVLMFVVMGLLAAIGLPGSRRSWEGPPPQPAPGQLTPQARAAIAQQQAPRARHAHGHASASAARLRLSADARRWPCPRSVARRPMNRAVIGIVAAGFLLFGLACIMTDMSASSQQAAVIFFTLAGLVLIIGIISESGGARESSSGDHTVNVYNVLPTQAALPQPPQYIPVYMPMPGYQPHALPPAYEPEPHYLPAPQYQPAAIEHQAPQVPATWRWPSSSEYRGAIDIVAEPVPASPRQIRQGGMVQLESPKASLARRVVRRVLS